MSSPTPLNVDARQSVITEVHRDQFNIDIHGGDHNSTPSPKSILKDSSISSAPFDSGDRYPAAECLSGTRSTLRNHITEALSSSSVPCICWLNGMAGTGKSAIAQSIAENFSDRNRLAASFFFSGSETGHNISRKFFPTIAHQLTISIPPLKTLIIKALHDDPSIPDKSLRHQFQRLILDPIRMMKRSMPSSMAVVIDAINECGDERLVKDIVTLIAEAQVNHSLPFRFLMASRPEPYIRTIFDSPGITRITQGFALEDFDAENDIRRFFHHHLTEIAARRREGTRDIPRHWPPKRQLEMLVHRSSGLFIFAATVVKYIDDPQGHPERRLDQLLAVEPNARSDTDAYTCLDQLYAQILSASPDIEGLKSVLGTMVVLFDPHPVKEIGYLISLDCKRISVILERLHSILLIPPDDTKAVRIFHESLRDFLTDHKRSSVYFVSSPTYHGCIAHQCLALLTTKFNRDTYVHSHQPYLDWLLQYACDHWASHLCRSTYSDELFNDLKEFGTKSLLSWIEASSVTHDLDNTLQSLRNTNQWLLSAASYNGRNRSNLDRKLIRRLYGLLQLFHEVEQYIREFLTLPPGIRLRPEFWTFFRLRRRAAFGRGRLYDDPTNCGCGYIGFISATPRQRLSYAWRRSAAFVSLKRIISGESSPLHTVDASIGGIRRKFVHIGPSTDEFVQHFNAIGG